MALPAADRELLRLSYFEGLEPAQIAERMGEVATRVRMRKSRALDRLRRAFLEAPAPRYEPGAAPTMTGRVLDRARARFPHQPVRTLDALHLAAALMFHEAHGELTMVSLNKQIRENAASLGLSVSP